ncbi:YfhO family protein [Dawidia soli]|uniref:YfhO family protein n=1 Tax=Dawidia soli TaxID=2782352 RepID=A0AAP2D5L3_9BACT|nr:YfhO family protein [Dawidia soli]MBT1685547.1 YfhO family protein [Dawidia soli]
MKKINFARHVLPHLVAIAAFLLVTVVFFSPFFFDNKVLSQYDIQQWEGSSKTLRDYREATGQEGLWADNMFSGMPAYLINLHWSNYGIGLLKRVLSLGLAHPYANIFIAFISYYIMLLAFRVRPYLAIGAAIAFGLSSYMIVGLAAGHNGRIGAIAFMPLVIAGIHLAYSGRRLLGLGITTAAVALQLKENHLQVTFYLLLIVLIYGLVQFIYALREKKVAGFFATTAMLLPAAIIGACTFIGQLWGVTEYGAYTIRGKSDLAAPSQAVNGLPRSYAFDANNGVWEPFMMLMPNFYGGSAANYLVRDQKSEVYQALTRSGDEQTANQLAQFTSAYWGPQSYTVPYYAGATIIFLFAVGLAFADRKYIWWLVPAAALGIMLSWGANFSAFNYFLFDHVPGFNKFRSVTFALIITLFTLPLLGVLGVEKLMDTGLDKAAKKKLLIVFGATGGLCLLFLLFAGAFDFTREGEEQLPSWFIGALIDDRKSLFRGDAFRSLAFIAALFIMLYFAVWKKVPAGFYAFVAIMIVFDVSLVDRRYLTKDNYVRKRETTAPEMTPADQAIRQDTSYYRVYNIQPGAFTSEARTAHYHYSVGGYHGAKLRRYQDLYDSCLSQQTVALIQGIRAGDLNFRPYGVINMLNIKYMMYGQQANQVIPNGSANGPAWFVREVKKTSSPAEELATLCDTDTKVTAVVNTAAVTVPEFGYDSAATISIVTHKPPYLKYQSHAAQNGLAVFSEIYYAKGWRAFIDGKEAPILPVNYVLRALAVPAGDHTIEFRYEPAPYVVGNKVMMASTWLTVLILLGSLGWSLRREDV